ncbi:hypothetical protein C8J57DRAFT_1511881 [Mycena rebaudengoi]|nr:hypothetical protein C8J57DRAFT_1511881 [Mycena rebaudengoi]
MYDEYGSVDKNFMHRTHLDAFVKMPAGILLQESLDIEDILGAWCACYHAEGPHKSPGALRTAGEGGGRVNASIIAASTVQSIVAETRQSAQGWMTCRHDEPEDQFFHQGIETGLSLSVDEGYESADEDEVEMAAVYAMRKARGSISSDDLLAALISVPSSSSEL